MRYWFLILELAVYAAIVGIVILVTADLMHRHGQFY
jgi:hypothetical protein